MAREFARAVIEAAPCGPQVFWALREAPSPSGKAEVCKTSTPGSNPGGASKFPKESEAHRRRDVDRRGTVPKICPGRSKKAGFLKGVGGGCGFRPTRTGRDTPRNPPPP